MTSILIDKIPHPLFKNSILSHQYKIISFLFSFKCKTWLKTSMPLMKPAYYHDPTYSTRHPSHPPSRSSLLLCKKEEDEREIRKKEDEIHRHLLRSSWVIEDEEEDDRPETM